MSAMGGKADSRQSQKRWTAQIDQRDCWHLHRVRLYEAYQQNKGPDKLRRCISKMAAALDSFAAHQPLGSRGHKSKPTESRDGKKLPLGYRVRQRHCETGIEPISAL